MVTVELGGTDREGTWEACLHLGVIRILLAGT
jgi:hypothetical protein